MFVPLLPFGVLVLLLCVGSLCDNRPGPEFAGKLSGIDVHPVVAAPSVKNGPHRGHNWTASMPGPQHMLSKRAPDPLPRRYGPVWPQGNNCVFCPEEELLKEDALTLSRQLTAKKLKTYMRGTPADLHNKCVFYTKNEDRNTALANPATEWACQHNKYTAWVSCLTFQVPFISIAAPKVADPSLGSHRQHLWPNKRMAQQNPRVLDFYGAYEEGNVRIKL